MGAIVEELSMQRCSYRSIEQDSLKLKIWKFNVKIFILKYENGRGDQIMNIEFKKILLWFFGITAVISFANLLYTPYMSLHHTGELQLKWSSVLTFMLLSLNFISIQRGYFDSLFK